MANLGKKVYDVVVSHKDKDGKWVNVNAGSIFEGEKYPKIVLNVLGQSIWGTLFTAKEKEETVAETVEDKLDDEIPF